MEYIDIPDDIIDNSNNTIKTLSINIDAINNSIKNIVETPIGSIPGNPEFGSKIHNFLFEQIDPLTSRLIEEEIRYVLTKWEPRVVLKEINVVEDADYNRLYVEVKYLVKSNIEKEVDLILPFNLN